MTKKRTKKSTLISSFISLILCISMLLGTTMAWFTDSVTNTGNRIDTGLLDVKLLRYNGQEYVDISDGTGDVFTSEGEGRPNGVRWEPGKTEVVYLAVKNEGDLALNFNVNLEVTNHFKQDTDADGNGENDELALGDAFSYVVYKGCEAPNAWEASPTTWHGMRLAAGVKANAIPALTAGSTELFADMELLPGTGDDSVYYFALAVHMNEEAGNEYMPFYDKDTGDYVAQGVTVDIRIDAEQMAYEEDSFDHLYDALGWIQAEDYRDGANGETYYDTTTGNANGADPKHVYSAKKNDDVDFYAHANFMTSDASKELGYAICNGVKGEWLTYDITIPETGVYDFRMIHAWKEAGTFNVYLDAGDGNGFQAIITNGQKPATTYNTTATDTAYGPFELEAGDYVIKFEFNNGFYLDALGFFPHQELAPQPEAPDEPQPDYDGLDTANAVYKTINVSATATAAADENVINVATIEEALAQVAALNDNMTGDIVVNIAPGYHELTDTIRLTSDHSGKSDGENHYNVIFRGADASSETVISGGTQVTGWQQVSGSELWKASLADAGVSEVRNLYINDYPAIRARSEYTYIFQGKHIKEGTTDESDGLLVDAANFPDFAKPAELEMVSEVYWRQYRVPVEGITYSNDANGQNVIFLAQPAWDKIFLQADFALKKGNGFYLENAMELLDEPGEFYYNKDTKEIYYYPYESDDMNTVQSYVGKVQQMVDIKGESADNKASNFIFENLSFKYGAWDDVSTYGLIAIQSDSVRDLYDGVGSILQSPGQFQANYAENITVKNSLFTCLGSSALQFQNGVANVKIEGNVIRDVSGAGIMIGDPKHEAPDGEKTIEEVGTCKNFMVKNNVLRRIANEYTGQTAISVYYEANINIVNNDIQSTPYTAISAGWGWEDPSNRSVYHKNIDISYNRIADVMEVLDDGGHIYTLGNLRGGTITNNYMKDSHNDMYGGIYLDAGSEDIIVQNNVSMGSPRWFFAQTGYAAKNITASGNYSDTSNWQTTKEEDKANLSALDITVEEAVIITAENSNADAKAIIDKAGVEEAYKSLLSDANIEIPTGKENRAVTRPQFPYVAEDKYAAKFGWIEAEDYQPGENGVTYYDKNASTDSSVPEGYREGDVDLLQKEAYYLVYVDGNPINDINSKLTERLTHCVYSGEWLTYKVLIPEDGKYNFKIRYIHDPRYSTGPATIRIDLNNESLDTPIVKEYSVPQTYASQARIYEHSFEEMELKAGEYLLKFEYVDAGFMLDKLGFFEAAGTTE